MITTESLGSFLVATIVAGCHAYFQTPKNCEFNQITPVDEKNHHLSFHSFFWDLCLLQIIRYSGGLFSNLFNAWNQTDRAERPLVLCARNLQRCTRCRPCRTKSQSPRYVWPLGPLISIDQNEIIRSIRFPPNIGYRPMNRSLVWV